MPSVLLRFVPFAVLAGFGAAAGLYLVPAEQLAVAEHLVGFPTSDSLTLQLRPVLLGILCALPAVAAFLYGAAGSLDRYLARQMLGAVGICALALIVVWVLLDVNDNLGEFQKAGDSARFLIEYYRVALPSVFVLLVPFALMLGLLYCLGRLSAHREIIAMIQTGRSVARVIAPLGAVGLFLSLACLLLNYHWAPWGEGYKQALLEKAKSGETSQARNILFVYHDSNQQARRVWMVGSFPYDYARGEPLRDVEIRTKDETGIASTLRASTATWNFDTRDWIFEDAVLFDQRALLPDGVESPEFIDLGTAPAEGLPRRYSVPNFPETPWQIIKPGLQKDYLGVPELRSWLKEHSDVQWAPRREFLTQWHYRWAQPWICLVVVFLAAPLGIVFTRRGTAGGVAIAVFLSASMLLAAEIALSLGDAGFLPPALAAWGTNLVFTALALFLLWRRLHGRPIYQSLKDLFPVGD